MNKKIQSGIKGFLPLFVLLCLMACKKEDSGVGLNLIPDGGNIPYQLTTLDQFTTRSVTEDSLRTDSLSTNILGVMNDPVFGQSRATLICQPMMPENKYDFSSATLDSITLTLNYHRSQVVFGKEEPVYYGNLDDAVNILVYKVAEDLVPENRYFSNYPMSFGDQIGSYSGRFFFFDSVEVVEGGDTFNVAPRLTIKLDDAFGNELISQSSSVFENNENFINYLKGIALVPQMDQPVGAGAFVGIDLDNSNTVMTVYYNGGEKKEFVFTNGSERINLYETVPASVISDQHNGSGSYNETFVQAMAGSKIFIEVNGLDSFITSAENLVINEATLRVKVLSGSSSNIYRVPPRMLLLQPSAADGSNFPIIDFVDQILPDPRLGGISNYGGTFNSEFGGYVFHFNRFLEQLRREYRETGSNNFRGFYLVIPSDYPITPFRAVLDTDGQNGGIEVSIMYTKLN